MPSHAIKLHHFFAEAQGWCQKGLAAAKVVLPRNTYS